MNRSFEEIDLSLGDFTRYFEMNRLGRLSFPNGKAFLQSGKWFENGQIVNLYVEMNDLYKMVCGWKINGVLVPLDDIVAVIAFGSAVRHPGYEEVQRTHRRYWLFGEKVTTIKRVSIRPSDADFLVITVKNLMREEVLAPISLETYDCGTWIKKGGIHLANRGVSQLLKGIHEGDTVSTSALREGVPVFFTERFAEVVKRANIPKTTPRKIFWHEDDRRNLMGYIE